MKIILRNLRSTCALGIISCFVLFLAASAPHRVHHLFENLPWTDQAADAEAYKTANPPLLIASSQTVGFEDHNYPFHGHRKSLAEHGSHGQVHGNHLDHVAGNNHHGGQDRAGDDSDANEQPTEPDIPLRANSPHDDAHHDKSAQTVCLLQAAAQHSHLSAPLFIDVVFLSAEPEKQPEVTFHRLSLFNPSPFSQRAPPRLLIPQFV